MSEGKKSFSIGSLFAKKTRADKSAQQDVLNEAEAKPKTKLKRRPVIKRPVPASSATARVKKEKAKQALIITIITAIATVGAVYYRESLRIVPDTDALEQQIASINLQISRFQAAPTLLPVPAYFDIVKSIATSYELEFDALEDKDRAIVNTGTVIGGTQWHAKITGPESDVLIAADTMQKSLPVQLGSFAARTGTGVATITVYGAPPEKVNLAE